VLTLERGSGGRVLRAWSEEDTGSEAEELEEVRRKGWAESIAEREPGVASVSAPVFGPGGELRAAVCASGPDARLGEHPGGRLAESVAAAAREIGELLGDRTPEPG
jgi:DNA-binding IclR family transcriptional regulator